MAPAKKRDRGSSQLDKSAEDSQVGLATVIPDSDTAFPPTDVLPPDVIRSEVNLLVLPFFALSRRDTHGEEGNRVSRNSAERG